MTPVHTAPRPRQKGKTMKIYLRLSLLSAFVLLLAACSQDLSPSPDAPEPEHAPVLSSQAFNFNLTTVDSAGWVGEHSSLALDARGNPVISYHDFDNRALKLVKCGTADCSSGNSIQTVDSAGFVGFFTSLALDARGNPVISYYDLSNDALKLVHCGNADCSSGNSIQTVDSAGFVGEHTSLVLDASGNPVISYYDNSNGALKLVKCGNADCSSGNSIQTVDAGDVGWYNSLVLDARGNPVISYYDSFNEALKLVHCGNADCSSGNSIQTVDSAGDVGRYSSLVLDASGNPIISYYDFDNDDLKLVHCGNADCSSGNSIQTVDSAGFVGTFTSLALDTSGNPVISYYGNAALKLVHCGNADCSSGNSIQTVDSAGGEYTSLALDASGNPIISYWGNLALKLASGNPNQAPAITSANTTSVEENQTGAIDVEATDDNDAEGSGLTFSLSGGADLALFTIDAGSGVVTFINAPDFEAPTDDGTDNVYNLQVTVTDSGGLTAAQDITITVTDINDIPVITSPDAVSVPENQTAVLDVVAKDDDVSGTFAFRVTGGPDVALFEFVGVGNELVFKSAPDFENPLDQGADNVYTIEIEVDDNLGGVATQTIAVTVTDVDETPADTTPPTATPSFDPAANAANWHNSDVTVTFNWTDNEGGSGIDPDNCNATAVVSDEGTSVGYGGGCRDLAGNVGETVGFLSIDKTAPETTLTTTPPATSTSSEASFEFSGSDALSGVGGFVCSIDDGSAVGVGPCTSPVSYTNLAAGSYTFSVVATDVADNSDPTPASYSFTVAPESLVCDPGSYLANPDDTSCTPADPGFFVPAAGATAQTPCTAGSFSNIPGADSCTLASPGFFVPTEAATQATACALGTFSPVDGATSCTVADIGFYVDSEGSASQTPCPAGTTTLATGSTDVSDCIAENAPPSADAAGPYSGLKDASIPLDGSASADPDGDSLSYNWRVNTSACSFNAATSVSPDLVCSEVGTYTVTLEVSDGNETATATATVTVIYDFGGFLDPIDPNSVNVVKAGRTVPISFSLNGDQGLSILDGSPTAVRVACDSGENLTEVDNTEPAGNSGLRYDASTDTYTYVWKTKKSWKRQCRELQLSLDDGMIYTAQFQFK